jgi:Protein of unknown function (DUF4231)
MPREIEGADWWRRLRRASGGEPPPSVTERLGWYARRVRTGRRATYAVDGTIIVVSAAIPAVAAAGASAGIAGVLGAIVTVLVGVRTLVRSASSWSRTAGTVVGMQRELVMWSLAAAPYDTTDEVAAVTLAARIEKLVAAETTDWAEQRALADRAFGAR